MIRSIADLQQMKEAYLEKMGQYSHLCMVCYGTGCMSSGCKNVRDAMVEELEKAGLTDKVAVIERGCMGTCAVGPVVYVLPDETYYTEMTPERVKDVVQKHFIGGEPVTEYTFYDSIQKKRVSNIHDVAFFRDQVRIALRNCGLIDVNCINSYVSKDGYLALAKILEKGDRMAVIEEMKRSGLRGRGGAGFPTGVKWEAAYREEGDEKYIICNADEGDPGAFMDRSVFEGDPHSVIEGMLIGGYAIGAFNVNNMEIIQGITEAAAELKAPLILQVSKGARAYANRTYLKKLVEAAVIETGLPIALHLDHGDSFELCKSCIEDGFTSVMIDASSKPFAENIALTRQVVEYAHDHGVVVEAELGTLAGIEDEVNVSAEDSSYTHPEEVEEFVSKTGCDSLAIAIGTSHGAYKFKPGTKPQLRFDVLEEVSRRLPGFPIVLHGSSSVPQDLVAKVNQYGGNMPGAIGVPEDQLRKAASLAVCKINIDSDLRLAMTASIREHFALHPADFDPRQYLKPARQAIKELVAHKIVDVLGCDGKAF